MLAGRQENVCTRNLLVDVFIKRRLTKQKLVHREVAMTPKYNRGYNLKPYTAVVCSLVLPPPGGRLLEPIIFG